jgi:signal transduction histidine kinase
MVEFPLQLLSLLLIIGGFFFFILEGYVRFDRSFLYLGGALVLFGCIPAIDIWIIPRCAESSSMLLWIRIQHVLTVALLPLVLWYLKNFLRSASRYLHLMVNVFVLFFSLVLFSDATLRVEGGTVERGPLYQFLFLPCFAVTGCFIFFLIGSRLKGTTGNERRILFYHLIGFTLLCSFGIIDLAVKSVDKRFGFAFHSFFILGVFAFGLMIFLIFTERLLILVADRRKAYEQLRSALGDMEEASTLRQIGESAAVINHEIKNYLVRIFGAAELLQLTEQLSTEGKEEIDAIKKTVADLQHFSMDILQLSRAKIIKEKELLTIAPLLRQCLVDHFPDQRERIKLICTDDSQTIHGEWEKLQHVFVNLIRNSLEAEAQRIEISLASTGSVLLISITDNGTGCAAEQIPELFKAFYTTKKGRQGTGLGLSISRAVVESHGGHISAYTFNELGGGRHGLKISITLPQYGMDHKQAAGPLDGIVLYREGMQDIGSLLQTFNNIGLYPSIIHRHEDLHRRKENEIKALIIAENAADRLKNHRVARSPIIVSVLFKNGMTYARFGQSSEMLDIFCEDFILTRLFSAG